MRRLLDVVLVVAILAAVGFGVYKLGHRVDSTSSNLAQHDSELAQPATRPAHHRLSRRTEEIVIAAVGGAAAVMLLVSMSSAASRRRRRQRWRAT